MNDENKDLPADDKTARPRWGRPVFTVISIEKLTLQGHCWDADSCYSTS